MRVKIIFFGPPLIAVLIASAVPVIIARADTDPKAEASPKDAPATPAAVKAWEETVTIPTYGVAEPDPDPMFYFGRNYQGAQGRVYPYPLYDTLTNVKADKQYQMLYLENEYVKIGILPELGGRVYEAIDKSNNYDFVYHQHAIKPALVGMIGAWISGGIEWNIPHHHRATTLLPVQSKIVDEPDGSKTIWVGELELRQRMRWAVGYTLHPGKSYLECSVRIFNRTPVANTMLCFANVAVHANENYQVIFPPSTQYVTFHGKREFTTWPIATTMFNGADFTKGVDVSWYKNHDAANSMFAWNYDDDFFAGYDHGKNAGIVSVADHHIVPGKKFWTWGNATYGKMWDKILTDDDGPYIELMVGAYSDNQPDYSWLQPYETKSFQMHWYPIRDIDGMKSANLDAAVNLEVVKPEVASDVNTTKSSPTKIAKLGFCTTSAQHKATASLKAGDKVLFSEQIDIDPTKPFTKEIPIPADLDEHNLRASLSVDGRELIDYSPVKLDPKPMPDPVKPPPAPKDIKSVEELYLAGQRAEQFGSPSLDPEPYWNEALARDPGDSRVNTVLGIRLLKQARFTEAEKHFRTAVQRLTKNYTSPKDGEPFYYLGVTLQEEGKFDEAYEPLSKATWSQAWRAPAYFALAQIDTHRRDFTLALDHVNRSLDANAQNVRALHLKFFLLSILNRRPEALAAWELAAKTDPLDIRLWFERWHDQGISNTDEVLIAAIRQQPEAVLEVVTDYAADGLPAESILRLIMILERDKSRIPPLAYYYLRYLNEARGSSPPVVAAREQATKEFSDNVFPFQWEAIPVLRRAIAANPQDARAPYYLGNLLFDWQPEEAIKLWQQSAEIDPDFAIVHRNLAAAYAHQKPTPDNTKAIAELEKAVACPQKYPLHFTELDELYAAEGAAPEKRLALLEKNQDVVSKRDDALSREIGLKVFAGKYDEAIALMTDRKFAVWEGATLDVADHWVNAHLLRGRKQLADKQFAPALDDFQAAMNVPENLPNGRSAGARNAELNYYIGLAHDALGEIDQAKAAWQAAIDTPTTPRRRATEPRISERQVQIYFQALAKRKLGQNSEADADLRGLLQSTRQGVAKSEDPVTVSAALNSHESPKARAALAHYVAGLAHLGLNEINPAQLEFEESLALAPDSIGPHDELLLLQHSSSP